jgi:SAM-dependent methyltransferase
MEEVDLFDKSAEYDEMLNKGLALSGEDKFYFAEGRLSDLKKNIPSSYQIKNILDFGCGIGDATILLKKYFTGALITGIDTASEAINYAKKHNSDSGSISYSTIEKFTDTNKFDLCFVNGVFHHILPEKRDEALQKIYTYLKPGGLFALFENNPHNPGTRAVMRRIPFDKDAITLSPGESKKLLLKNGFKPLIKTRFLFYFPRKLSFMRPTEKHLVHLPLGAQYYVLVEKKA